MWQQFFEIEGKFLGHAARGLDIQLRPPLGAAFFCSTRGRIWALCPIADREFMIWSIPCANHTRSFAVPGSIYLSWDADFNAAMPDAVVRREFEIHLAYAERNQ